MRIEEQHRGSAIVLQPAGPLVGAAADEVREAIAKAAEATRGPVVLDAGQMAFVDSHGLESLLDAAEDMVRRGRALRLAEVTATVREVLDLTELASSFDQYDDVETALSTSTSLSALSLPKGSNS